MPIPDKHGEQPHIPLNWTICRSRPSVPAMGLTSAQRGVVGSVQHATGSLYARSRHLHAGGVATAARPDPKIAAMVARGTADISRNAVFERSPGGPASVCEIAADLPVSRLAVSRHLKVLEEAGLVRDEADRAPTKRSQRPKVFATGGHATPSWTQGSVERGVSFL